MKTNHFLLLLLLGSMAGAAPVQRPAESTAGLGMNIHFTDPKPGELEMMQAAGVHWVRMDFLWAATEHKRGEYDFSAYDRLLAALEKHGMRALLILDYGNNLYEPDRAVRTAPGREAFARWAAAAVQHFAGHGIYWEIWNEPNGGFWKPKAEVTEYSALALAACQAMRAAAPAETIIGPATSTIDLAFIEGCAKAGLLQYWDAVSVHPYRQEGPENVAGEYAKLRRLLAKYRELPIISGEWGYSSAWERHDPERQGKMLAREWLMNIAQGIPISIWYDWHEDGTDPKEAEHHFGTVGNAYHAGAAEVYEPKPAYRAARALTTALAGYRFERLLALGGSTEYVLLFRKGEALKLAAWTMRTEPFELKLPGDRGLSITLTDTPRYVDLPKGDAPLAATPARSGLTATLAPAGDGMQLRVENDGRERVSISAQLTGDLTGKAVASLGADSPELTLAIPGAEKLLETFRAGVRLTEAGHVLLEIAPRTWRRMKVNLFSGAKVRPDGDAKIASEQTLEVGDAPEPPPSGSAEVLRLNYHAAKGWKFLQVQPGAEGNREIEGHPQAFGLWIYGDGKGGSVRLRLADAAGRTWQPGGPRIDWKGWRYVELPLTPETAHWSGAKEGGIAWPLRWDTLLLLDKPREEEITGEIYLTRPWTVE